MEITTSHAGNVCVLKFRDTLIDIADILDHLPVEETLLLIERPTDSMFIMF